MCGRFSLKTPVEELVEKFETPAVSKLSPHYNIAPSQEILTVLKKDEGRAMSLLFWGLIPSWSKDGRGFINARAETIVEKPSFRSAFKRRPCLIPADGFFEWRKQGREKQPFYFRMKDGESFAFAGIWEEWKSEGEKIPTCAIITTQPNEIMSPVHDRMPVILHERDYDLWLDADADKVDERIELLQPYPAAEMEAYPVSTLVNNPGYDVADAIRKGRQASS
jgi:putative SOS response-associated peptidase YedK